MRRSSVLWIPCFPSMPNGEGLQPAPLAGGDRLAVTMCWPPTRAAGPNGFTHQDPGFLDHVANRRPMWCGSICRGR
jgi:hypothetical protein